MTPVRLHVDSWDPSYAAAVDPAETGPAGQSSARLVLDVERPPGGWQPLSPPPELRTPPVVLMVDGVRRVDARIWVEPADGPLHPGLAASYAAGVVRCDLRRGRAEVVRARVERGLFTPAADAVELGSGITRYPVRPVSGGEPAVLTAGIQADLQALEALVSAEVRSVGDGADDLLVIDGPLRGRAHLPRALGYVKTHHTQYLPAELAAIIGQLRPGQRTPVFLLGTSWHRYTWYLKLPGPGGSPWAGVVRVEAAADLPRGEVIELSDRAALTLPRFASPGYKDARAPQNLTPIAGLERRLRGMLGDPRLLLRSLVSAAAAHAAGLDAAHAAGLDAAHAAGLDAAHAAGLDAAHAAGLDAAHAAGADAA